MVKLYVNVYEYGRAYGGPEEGGWWFDVLDPLESHPCDSRKEADALCADLRELFPDTNAASSVLGGEDYRVMVEPHKGKAYPESRPHYE